MRLVVLAVLGAGIASLGWRCASGNRRAWITVPLAAAVLAFVITGYFEVRWQERQSRLEAAVAEIIDRDGIDVKCERTFARLAASGDHLGFVGFPEDGSLPREMHLLGDVCDNLDRFAQDPGTNDRAVYRAVHTLTHESMHLTGVVDEALAECAAVQRDYDMAKHLGASPSQAERMSATYYAVNYASLPPEYFSAECREGGALDDRLPNAPWDFNAPTG